MRSWKEERKEAAFLGGAETGFDSHLQHFCMYYGTARVTSFSPPSFPPFPKTQMWLSEQILCRWKVEVGGGREGKEKNHGNHKSSQVAPFFFCRAESDLGILTDVRLDKGKNMLRKDSLRAVNVMLVGI